MSHSNSRNRSHALLPSEPGRKSARPSAYSGLLYGISRIRAAPLPLDEALRRIADLTLRSVHGLALAVWLRESGSQYPTLVVLHKRGGDRATGNLLEALQELEENASAMFCSPVMVGRENFGEVCLYSDSTKVHEIFPLELTSFLGQQIGLLVETARLKEVQRSLSEEVQQGSTELATRKALDRAKGLLAASNSISEQEADRRLRHESVKSGQPLLDTARAVVT